MQWHSRSSACVRVNGGHFEHKFGTYDFLVYVVKLIDRNVQSVLCEMCYFVSETYTQYGSNKTNVWQEILTPSTLPFSCAVVHEKI